MVATTRRVKRHYFGDVSHTESPLLQTAFAAGVAAVLFVLVGAAAAYTGFTDLETLAGVMSLVFLYVVGGLLVLAHVGLWLAAAVRDTAAWLDERIHVAVDVELGTRQ